MAARQTTATDRAGAVAMPVADGRGAAEPDADPTDQRRCIGSERFGIVGHEAPVAEFPAQPSQKDGLGRMCRPHWAAYTSGLRKAALARKATNAAPAEPKPVATSEPTRAMRGRKAAAAGEGGAG